MSLDISTVVQVSISRQTAQVTQKGFGRGLILGTSAKFTSDTARLYSSIGGVAADFALTDPEYRAAAAYFSQNPAPQDCYIAQSADLTPDVAMTTLTANGYTDFYGICIAGDTWDTQANLLLLAAWNEAQSFKRIVAASLNEAGILNPSSTTDTAYLLKQAGYTRTFLTYSAGAADYTRAAAWLGVMLPTPPGSANWAYKTLAGEVADPLTTAQLTALEGKNANAYVNIGGVNVTQLGTMADGEYVDTIVGCDWLQSIIQQDIYSLLATSPKVPFTDSGIALVQGIISGDLKKAVNAGVLASYNVPQVLASSFSSTQKQSRVLSNLTFTGVLAGAVNKVTVQGNVTF